MKRFEERKQDFYNALVRLQEALQEEKTDVVIDGVLHRFEFTFEISWKTIKDYLEYLGVTEKIGSPREIIQLGFKQGIISDGEAWIQMMLSRNALSHLYDEKTSREIYEKIKINYINLFNELKEKFESL
ncbi:MAG: nucleotidyltransferase [Clostridiales bacterium]|nr:nucleotidyltransferase [Clostridiales bacterium]